MTTTLTPPDAREAGGARLETVGRLMRGLAQELDRLLRAVLADASLLDGALAPEQSRARDYLEELEQAARRASGTIGRIVALAEHRPGTGGTVDVGRTALVLAGLLRDLVADHVSLTVDVEDEGPFVAAVDGAVFEQVLLALVADARDVAPPNSAISIAPWRVKVAEWNAAQYPLAPLGEYVGFTVSGPGSGARPGLEVARALVAAAGGFVSVDDAGPAGVSVRVHLPAVRPEVSRTGS